MASTAISYGTEVWLADLKRDGWTVNVFEHLGTQTFGVLAEDGKGSGVFVPCADEKSACELLERVGRELDL